MVLLNSGILYELWESIKFETKAAPAHSKPSVLQVIGIVPGVTGNADHLWPHHGFCLKVSDSAHCTYMSVEDGQTGLILNDELQIGQLIQVDSFKPASPVPILFGVKPIPGKHHVIGSPQDLIFTDACNFLSRNSLGFAQSENYKSQSTDQCFVLPSYLSPNVQISRDGSTPDSEDALIGSAVDANMLDQLEEKPANGPHQPKQKASCSTPIFSPSPGKTCVRGRHTVEKTSWMNASDNGKDDLRRGTSFRLNYIPQFSPTKQFQRSVSASPARDLSVRSSLFMGRDAVSGTGKASPNVNKSRERRTAMIMLKPESPSGHRAQSSAATAKSTILGKSGKKASDDVRKSVNMGRLRNIRSPELGQAADISFASRYKNSSHSKEKDQKENLHGVCTLSEGKELQTPLESRRNSTGICLQTEPVSCSTNVTNIKVVQGLEEDCTWNAITASLAKKALQRHKIAAHAASKALKEAAAAQLITDSVSALAELYAMASLEHPAPHVGRFFEVYTSLGEVSSSSDARTESIDGAAYMDLDVKGQNAMSWITAALSTGLAACPVEVGSDDQSSMPESTVSQLVGKERTLEDWVKGDAVCLLAKDVQEQAEVWFMKYMDSALDGGYRQAIKGAADAAKCNRGRDGSSSRMQVPDVLSDLKRVNDWLDQIKANGPDMKKGVALLKQKLYDLLIQLVLQHSPSPISHAV